jgi:CheY-like chemotaxis protein
MRSQLRIYLIEDDNRKAERIKGFISQIAPDAEILRFGSFQSGLKAIEGSPPNLVVLDMTLPTFDMTGLSRHGRPRSLGGYELLRKMKLRSIVTHVFIITQLETFGDAKSQISFEEIKNRCAREFPGLFLEAVYYRQGSDSWHKPLENALRAVTGRVDMISMLFVEDEAEKRRLLTVASLEVKEISQENIEYAADVMSARRALQRKSFDLVVLDINLPKRAEELPSPKGGLDIVRWLKGAGRDHLPESIIALTAYDESLAIAESEFGKLPWTLLRFSYSNSEWKEKLKGSIVHLIEKRSPPYRNDGVTFYTDLGIVTALEKPELQGLLDIPAGWKKQAVKYDDAGYYSGIFRSSMIRYAASLRFRRPIKGCPMQRFRRVN